MTAWVYVHVLSCPHCPGRINQEDREIGIRKCVDPLTSKLLHIVYVFSRDGARPSRDSPAVAQHCRESEVGGGMRGVHTKEVVLLFQAKIR